MVGVRSHARVPGHAVGSPRACAAGSMRNRCRGSLPYPLTGTIKCPSAPSTRSGHRMPSTSLPPSRPTVTLREVADAVGISRSAVSMALSDHPRISEATKAAVRAAAANLGYVANSAGRALRAGRSDSIAVVVPNTGQHVFGHPYFMLLLVGVTAAANDHDAMLMVSTNPDETHGVAAYERVLRSQAAAGAIIASASINDRNVNRMVDGSMPVVLIGRFPHLPEAVSVSVDDVAGAAAVTRHLVVGHGLRRIGHISGPLDHQTAIDRYEGFRAALAGSGGATHALAIGDFSEESGRAAAAELLDSMPDIDAIFAANDEMAYGALLELRARRLGCRKTSRWPATTTSAYPGWSSPALTTMRVPAEDLGRRPRSCCSA